MAKIKIDKNLYKQLRDYSVLAGYSSVDEFIIHILQKEAAIFKNIDDAPNIMKRLKDLGSIV